MSSFTVETLHGYEEGKRYEKHLKYVREFGNAKNRGVIMRDDQGVELLWSTNDYTKAYQYFRTKAVYKFTVNYITNFQGSIPQINIRHMTLAKKPY